MKMVETRERIKGSADLRVPLCVAGLGIQMYAIESGGAGCLWTRRTKKLDIARGAEFERGKFASAQEIRIRLDFRIIHEACFLRPE
jgi:hypothetical protein